MDVSGGERTARIVVAACMLCTVVAAAAHVIRVDQAATNALKIITASLTVLFVPGVLVVLLSRLQPPVTVLETLAWGAAASVGTAAFSTERIGRASTRCGSTLARRGAAST